MMVKFLICIFAIFLAHPDAIAKPNKAAVQKALKKIKRDRARNSKYHKKDLSFQAMAERKNKILQQEAFLQSQYSQKFSKEAEKRIDRVAMEFAKSKTVRDWMNKTNRKNRLARRMNFAKYMNQKLPKFVKGKYSIGLYSEKKNEKGMTVTLFPAKAGLQFIVDGRNLTRKNNESFKNWQKRVGLILSKKQNALLDWLIPQAYAAEYDTSQLYTNMFGLSLNDGWEDQSYQEGQHRSEDFEMLVNDALLLRETQSLRCEANRSARLNANIDGTQTGIVVSPQRDGTGMIEMGLVRPGSNQAVGTLKVRNDGRHSYIDVPGDERNYPSETIPGTVRALVNGQPIPQINHGIFDQSGERADPGDVVSAVANLRACKAAQEAGADTASCDPGGSPSDYRTCMTENFMQSDLDTQGINWGGLVGAGPSGGLSDMDRMAALNLKVQLLDSYARYPTNMVMPGGFPQVNHYVTVSPYGPTADSVRSILAQSQGDELYQAQVIECFESAIAGSNCSGNQLSPQVISQLQHLATPMRRNGTFPAQVPATDLLAEARSLLESSPAACRGLLPEDRLSGLEDYATLQEQSNLGDGVTRSLHQTLLNSDIAMACCGNAQCRNALTGVEHGGSYQIGTPSSQ